MKKILLGMVTSIIISIFFMNNIILAEQDETKWPTGTPGETQEINKASDVGINLSDNCLMKMWTNCFDYEKLIWIDKTQNKNITAASIAQDVILSATYMVWTVLTIVIIYCGLMYIFASRDGKDVSQYKKWLIYAAIWALLVWWAYAIVRLIQYIAKW